MAHLRINAEGTRPVLHRSSEDSAPPDTPAMDQLADILAQESTRSGPIIIMIHGYKFDYRMPRHCPHNHILAPNPQTTCWKAVSWTRHLGFGRGPASASTSDIDAQNGTSIAFGWRARGTIWRAYSEAARAGLALADLVKQLRQHAPHRPLHVLGHSLGARVLLQALPHLPHGAIQRAVLLAGAECALPARRAMDTPAGRSIEVLNVTSRENDLFDWLLESVIPLRGPALGLGLPYGDGDQTGRNWADLQLDDPETLRILRTMGHRIAPPRTLVCHWSSYLRPGAFPLYAAFLRAPDTLPIAQLRAALPGNAGRRWSRIVAHPRVSLPLPFGAKPSS